MPFVIARGLRKNKILHQSRASPVHTLVLLRHGESTYNLENRFTGWADASLTSKGIDEAIEAGKLLRNRGYMFDSVVTSALSRAKHTAEIVVGNLGLDQLQVESEWRLNERHYGTLQRRRKDDQTLFSVYGSNRVLEWRRSYEEAPPPLGPRHADYRASKAKNIFTESLLDCQERVGVAWAERLIPRIASGERLLIVAHANTIRALIKTIDGISALDIRKVKVPNAVPLVYHLSNDKNLSPVTPEDGLNFHGEYLACSSNHKRVVECIEAHNSALRLLWQSLVNEDELVGTDPRVCVDDLKERASKFSVSGGNEYDTCQMLANIEIMHELVLKSRHEEFGRAEALDDSTISYCEFLLAFSSPDMRHAFSGKKKTFRWLQ